MTDQSVMVLMPGTYSVSSVRLAAETWTVRAGKLIVRSGTEPVAEFSPERWAGIVADSHLMSEAVFGGLLAARRALTRIVEGCRTGNLTAGQIARIAEDGLMEVAHEGVMEP